MLILACVLCVGTVGWQDSDGADNETFNYDGLTYEILDETSKTVSVKACLDKTTTSVTIPDTASKESKGNEAVNYTVISIGEAAFNGCSVLESIDLPDSLTAIGVAAFSSCPKLDNVIIPNSVKTITNYVFQACYGLTTVKLPDNLETIGAMAFNVCSGLKSIYLPDSVKSIGNQAFFGCTGLQSIRFGKEMTDIAEDAFKRGKSELTTFYDEKKETPFNLKTDIGELQGRLFKADETDTSKMIRQPLYTLTFDCGDSVTMKYKYNEGDRIAKPDDPERTGYSFMYWAKDGKEFDFANAVMPAEDMTLTAVWKADAFTVTFVTGTGTEIAEKHVYGEAITLPGEGGKISKTGYSLSGWQISGESDAYKPGTEYIVMSEVTFTAVWTVNHYTISFDPDGGSAVDPITQDYGTLVKKPADPTKEGYRFVCWEKDGEEYAFGTMPAEDITLTAVWETLPSPVPSWDDDDDDPYVPVPDSDTGGKSSDAGSGASVAAVAIAAGCAAALLAILAMIGKGRSRS